MKKTFVFSIAVSAVLILTASCGGSNRFIVTQAGQETPRKTCLVLSVGGPDGVAHIGAIKALRERNVQIDCIGGTSMGALVGALYAARPRKDLEKQMSTLLHKYVKKTKAEGKEAFVIGAVLGGVAIALSGGTATVAVLGGAASGLGTAAFSVDEMDLSRFAGVLHKQLGKKTFAQMSIPFATFYVPLAGRGSGLVTVKQGKVAAAVKKSIANPKIFSSFDAIQAGYLDPGVDRVAAVPIQDMCALHPGVQILAINVTERPAMYDSKLSCPVREIMIPRTGLKAKRILTSKTVRSIVVRNGYNVTLAALDQ